MTSKLWILFFQIFNTGHSFTWYPDEIDANNYCPLNYDHSYYTQHYSNLIKPLVPIFYDSSTNTLNQTYFLMDQQKEYRYTGTFRDQSDGERCKVCAYHDYFYTYTECSGIQGIRNCYTPMFGYCYDGYLSEKMSCVQNTYLEPIQFFGEFFYPEQKPVPNVNIMHLILDSPPSTWTYDYEQTWETFEHGMSVANVLKDLRRTVWDVERDIYDDTIQTPTIQNFRRQFTNNNRWALWGQHRCFGFCHRDSSYLYRMHNTNDQLYNENKTLTVMKRYVNGTLIICHPCQSTYVSYKPDNFVDKPYFQMYKYHQYTSYYCIPWFGSVPRLDFTLSDPNFEYSTRILGTSTFSLPYGVQASQSITQSNQIQEIVTHLCPVNSYNRKCAYFHLKESGYEEQTRIQPSCQSCDAGWHTDGKTGSWFCIPPRGKQFVYYENLKSFWDTPLNQSKAWSRRDLIQYELECSARNFNITCRQCDDPGIPGARGLSPEQFNEKYIFDPLLLTRECPSNYYCPHPLEKEIACPANRPCSYPGSFSQEDCSCCEGSFWDSSQLQCQSCNDPTSCPAGQYLLGYTDCKNKVGLKSTYGGGICQNCTQKPTESVFSGMGRELNNGNHICEFQCNNGFSLIHTGTGGFFDACDYQYKCEFKKEPWSFGGSRYFFSSLSTISDRLTISFSVNRFTCTSNLQFSNYFTFLRSMIQDNPLTRPEYKVSDTCSQANQSFCGGQPGSLCRVSKNATLFNDYECQSCFPQGFNEKPSNASWYALALSAVTDPAGQSQQCKWTCNKNFFLNQSTSSCVSCTAFARLHCSANQSVEGMGCSDVQRPFLEPYSLNCVDCPISRATPTGKYLDTDICDLRNCSTPVIPLNHYISQTCGSTNSNYQYSQCSTCGSNQWQNAPCTQVSNTDCKPCTTNKPGYFKISECSTYQDSNWLPCPLNKYCSGDGLALACPVNMISRPLSQYLSDCKCSKGWTFDNLGSCIRKVCPSEMETFNSPSLQNNIISPYYYTYENEETQCKLCDINLLGHADWNPNQHSFASGNRFSCRCPRTMYSPLVSIGNISCASCNNRALDSCTSAVYFRIQSPTTCSSGLEKGNSKCFCILPPFSQSTSSLSCTPKCMTDFVDNKEIGFQPLPLDNLGVTGSSVYVSLQSSWTSIFNVPAYRIKKTYMSGDARDWASDNVRLVFWSIQDDPLKANRIFFRTYRETESAFCSSSTCNVYNDNINDNSWNPLCPEKVNSGYVLLDFSVFKWFTSAKKVYFAPQYTPFPTINTWISALVKQQSTASSYMLQIVSIQLSKDEGGSVLYPENSPYCGGSRSIPLNPQYFHENTSVVSTTSAYGFPGIMPSSSVKKGAFYAALNDPKGGNCGLFALSVNETIMTNWNIAPKTLYLNMSRNQRQILALAVNVEFGILGITVYTLFSDFEELGGGIQRYRWDVEDKIVNIDIVSKLNNNVHINVPPSQSKITQFEVAWSRQSESDLKKYIFFLNYDSDPHDQNSSILVADSVQQTLTPIMGMPYSSYPGTMSFVEEDDLNVKMMGNGKSSLYFLPLQRCLSASSAQYWTGTTCQTHQCRRRANCQSELNLEYNSEKGECQCKNGYYKNPSTEACIECTESYYCNNNDRTPCPAPNMISERRSSRVEDCRCAYGNYLMMPNYQCRPCESGFFCPNGVQRLACPGSAYHENSVMSSNQFPDTCSCNAGFHGPNCAECRPGYTCAYDSTMTSEVRNLAVTVLLELKPAALVIPSNMLQDRICQVFAQKIYEMHISTQTFPYFNSIQGVIERLYCKYYSNTDSNGGRMHGMSFISLMIQVNEGDTLVTSSLYSIYEKFWELNSISNINTVKTDMTEFIDVKEVRPMDSNQREPKKNKIKSTIMKLCASNQIPNSARTICECSPGYRNQFTRCVPCALGWYKPLQGNDLECLQCPVGKTTLATGSVQCISNLDVGNNSTQSSEQQSITSLLPIIIGSAVGGVVFIIIIISVICFYS